MLDLSLASLGEEKGHAELQDELVYGVFSNNLAKAWPKVLPLIISVLEHSEEYTPNQIYKKIEAGEAQLMVGERGGKPEFILVTTIVTTGGALKCSLFLAAGKNAKHWISYLDSVESWAKKQGCVAMTINGRPGWKKLLPGYKIKDIVLEKILWGQHGKTA